MKATIAVLPGDGIGPEVTSAAVAALQAVGERYHHEFRFVETPIGGAAIDQAGTPLPDATITACERADAAILGAVGGEKWANRPRGERPEDGLLALRKRLGLFANVRPVKAMSVLADASPLKEEIIDGVDMVVVRELTGGIYFGKKTSDAKGAMDECVYSVEEIERVARVAFTLARKRQQHVTSVDKANVLETSRLWRTVVTRVAKEEFPDVTVDHMLVDAAAMHLVRTPTRFDVVLTENMFGDILTDEAAAIAGSIGMLPSASWNGSRFGLYEPIHGSAPDIAGKGAANPCGAILSAAMLLRHSLGLEIEAHDIERCVEAAIVRGVRTPDLCPPGRRFHAASTREMQQEITGYVRRIDPKTGEKHFTPVM